MGLPWGPTSATIYDMRMSQAVRDTVAELETQREDVARQVAEAQVLFETSAKQLQRLDAAISSMRDLFEVDQASHDRQSREGTSNISDEQERTGENPVDDSIRSEDEQSARESAAPVHKPPRRRIQSTTIVGDIVSDAQKPITRDEIRQRFRESGLAPASWQNPENAVGNAITRAVERKLIREVSPGVFVPVRTPSADVLNHQRSADG
jgi:hypothetical protein